LNKLEAEIIEKFGNKLRLRVCGICIIDQKILLVKHHAINSSGIYWAPPGGGLVYGESIHQCLQREFKEEANLDIEIQEFLFYNEYLKLPLHAVELFFRVKPLFPQKAELGIDPELDQEKQILTELKWLTKTELQNIPETSKSTILTKIEDWL
jgi:8-oxo-dGTP diphosphatase